MNSTVLVTNYSYVPVYIPVVVATALPNIPQPILLPSPSLSLLPYTRLCKMYNETFLSNLPENFLDFEVPIEFQVALYNYVTTPKTTIKDVKKFYSQMCVRMHHLANNLLFSTECIAPGWLKMHPDVIGKIYAKLWYPTTVTDLVLLGKKDVAKFAKRNGALAPRKIY